MNQRKLYMKVEAVPTLYAEVLDDLRATRVPSFHHFKLRLFMAVQRSTFPGVVVGDVYQAWASAGMDPQALAARTGWPEGVVKTVAAYQDNPTRLSFPTLEEAQAALREFFEDAPPRFPPMRWENAAQRGRCGPATSSASGAASAAMRS
jgi:hypothetical protein